MSTLKCLVMGLPNVGKSLFVNQIAAQNRSLVFDQPGVTRDILSVYISRVDYTLEIMDSPGVDEFYRTHRENPLYQHDWTWRLSRLTKEAVSKAHLVLFMMDGRRDLSPVEEDWVRWLLKEHKHVIGLVNKIDHDELKNTNWEVLRLGFKECFFISALHKRGFDQLLQYLDGVAQSYGLEQTSLDPVLSLSIIGRPNVGKSSILNALVHKTISCVTDEPGTTRDPVETYLRYQGQLIKVVDTAGIRRHARREDDIEMMSAEWAIRSITHSDISLLVVDASLGWTDQDKRLAHLLSEKHQTTLILHNKWDLMDDQKHLLLKDTKPDFVNGWPVLNISVVSNRYIGHIIPKVLSLHNKQKTIFKPHTLNKTIASLSEQDPLVGQMKIKFIKQLDGVPPLFKVFSRKEPVLKPHMKQYFLKKLKETLDLKDIPVCLLWSKTD